MPKKNKTLRLILGDQLNLQHPWYQEKSSEVIYLMAEMHQESEYVTHHIQKIIGFFASMRALADALSRMGHQVIYIRITDKDAKLRLEEIIDKQIAETGANRFEYQLPDEWRLDQQLKAICSKTDIDCSAVDTHHFLSERMELRNQFPKGKNPLMETLTNQTNDETFNQLQQKLAFYKQQAEEAFIMADIEIKKQDPWTKQRRIKNDLNRFNMYELPNRTNRYGWRRNN